MIRAQDTNGDGAATIAKLPANTTSYTDSNIASGSWYRVRATASSTTDVNKVLLGGTVWSNWAQATANTKGGTADINHDGKIDRKDAVALRDLFLKAGGSSSNDLTGDVNGDGKFDLRDFKALYFKMSQDDSVQYDMNGDGKFDRNDAYAVANAVGAKVGDQNYDPILDINFDGTIDLKNDLYKMLFKLPQTKDIQYDVNQDGRFDISDVDAVADALNTHIGDKGYKALADFTLDGKIDHSDLNWIVNKALLNK